jgi:hypothetical protein
MPSSASVMSRSRIAMHADDEIVDAGCLFASPKV